MARLWVHTMVHTHTPISRQIGVLSASLVVSGTLARRNVSIFLRAPSTCRCWKLAPPAARAAQQEAFTSPFFPFGRLSPSVLHFRGMERAHISTGKATAGSEIELGSGSKNQGREILVQHLLLKEDQVQLLTDLQLQFHEGLDLSDLAEEHSICPSKEGGGMLGWLKLGQTDPVFEEAAFNAPLNKLVRVKTKHGWHLLQVLNERTAHFLAQIQVEAFHKRMQDPNFLEEAQLIDVREPNEISTAAIKGFEAYPLSQFGQWAPNILDDLEPEKDTFVLCHHGVRSMQAASWLQSQGFKRLYNIVGGIDAYSKRVDRTVPTY